MMGAKHAPGKKAKKTAPGWEKYGASRDPGGTVYPDIQAISTTNQQPYRSPDDEDGLRNQPKGSTRARARAHNEHTHTHLLSKLTKRNACGNNVT